MLGMLSVWSQLQADMTSEGTKAALQTLQDKGVKLGPRSLAQTNPETVQEIQALYATGSFTVRSLADHLNQSCPDLRTKSGKPWQPTQVQRTLHQDL
jgi:DNA invertase Pin-like site-specific DNA recombinase